MEQKGIYQHCLIIGISALLAFSACEEQVDYRVRAEWIYTNETTQPLAFSVQGVDTVLNPTESYTFSMDTEGPEDVTEESYGSPFDGIPVRYGDDQCLIYEEGGGPLATENYESEKLAERYYKFVYRFRESEFSEVEDCN